MESTKYNVNCKLDHIFCPSMVPSLYYVQVAIRALGFDVKKADVQKIMRDCDKDNTGKISLADFNEISMSHHLDSGL